MAASKLAIMCLASALAAGNASFLGANQRIYLSDGPSFLNGTYCATDDPRIYKDASGNKLEYQNATGGRFILKSPQVRKSRAIIYTSSQTISIEDLKNIIASDEQQIQMCLSGRLKKRMDNQKNKASTVEGITRDVQRTLLEDRYQTITFTLNEPQPEQLQPEDPEDLPKSEEHSHSAKENKPQPAVDQDDNASTATTTIDVNSNASVSDPNEKNDSPSERIVLVNLANSIKDAGSASVQTFETETVGSHGSLWNASYYNEDENEARMMLPPCPICPEIESTSANSSANTCLSNQEQIIGPTDRKFVTARRSSMFSSEVSDVELRSMPDVPVPQPKYVSELPTIPAIKI